MTDHKSECVVCVVDGHHGIYLPQIAVDIFRDLWVTPSPEDIAEDITEIDKGPDSEFYWDAWSNLLNLPVCVNGKSYLLWQGECGDLFLAPEDGADDFFEAYC